jgi:hypothetical protein
MLSQMGNVMSGEVPQANNRKTYEKPTVRQITQEQALLKLLGHASLGDPGAKELLSLMFPPCTMSKSNGQH